MQRRMLGGILAAAVWLGSPAAQADSYVVDGIAAVVGDEAILLSAVRRRARPFIESMHRELSDTGERLIAAAKIYRQLIDAMVNERLVAQAARKAQVTVEEADVERALDTVAQQNGLSRVELDAAVSRQAGMTAAEYREEVRRQILEGKMLMALAQQTGTFVTEDELRALYDELKAEDPDAVPSFDLGRPALVQRLHQRRLERLRVRWLERLRQDTYVEVRLTP